MTAGKLPSMLLPVLLSCGAGAQAVESANGTATIRVDDQEYTIPIVCDKASSPEIDLYTETAARYARANRTSKQRTADDPAMERHDRPHRQPGPLRCLDTTKRDH